MDKNKNSDNSSTQVHENKLDSTIIPFNYRKSQILSISFRSLDFEMGQFRLKIESDGENKIEAYSNFTEMTLVRIIPTFLIYQQVPKFQFDYKNKEINLLNETTYSKFILKVLDKNDQEKIKFDINLLDLTFLGEELYTTSILFYPIVIFEFMNGYYTTSSINEKNNFLINENVKNNENILKMMKIF